jgi:hypothetical protein
MEVLHHAVSISMAIASLLCMVMPMMSPAQAAPVLTITVPGPGPFATGTTLQLAVDYADVPAGAALVVRVEADLSPGEQHTEGAAGGVLMLVPAAVEGSGRHEIIWQNQRLGCAPTDAPMWCRTHLTGRYKLVATLYNRRDFSILGWPSRNVPPVIIASAATPAFLIDGEPDLTPLSQQLRGFALLNLMAQMGFHDQGVDIGGYLDQGTPLSRDTGGFTQKFTANPPFAGEITVRVAPAVVGPYGVRNSRLYDPSYRTITGTLITQPGLVPYAQAAKTAEQLARTPYLSRVRFPAQPGVGETGFDGRGDFQEWSTRNPDASAYLSSGVQWWAFRAPKTGEQGPGYWLFIIYAMKAGGSEGLSDPFADQVLVRVEAAGKACKIATAPYKTGFPRALTDNPDPCP